MAGEAVPTDDLPGTEVPANDLPSAEKPRTRVSAGDVGKFILRSSPISAPLRAMEMLDKGAYKAGGVATDVSAKVLPPEAAGAVGYATNVAVNALPALVGGETAKLLKPAFEKAGRDLMQSALKPTLEQLRTGKAAKAIDTMLNEGVNVTPGGLSKLRGKIGELNDQITDAIKNSPAVVDKGKVVQVLQQTFKKFESQVNPQSDLKAIRKAWNEFMSHPLLTGKQDIPVKLAQELKSGTYKALGDKSYGELKGATIEAQKDLARGLKEEIGKAVPGISDLNAQESKILNAMNVTERRVLMDANKNPIGLGWLAFHPESWIGFMADRSPLIKSLLARAMYSGSEQIPPNVARGLGTGAGMLSEQDE